MRVLVVTNMYPSEKSPRRGIFVEREVGALAARGVEVSVVVVEGDRSRLDYLLARRRVRNAVEQFSPDLVHVHYGLTLASVPPLDVPVVCTFHGTDLGTPWKQAVSRLLARKLSASIVVSESMAAKLAGVPGTVAVIGCGVDTGALPSISRDEARSSLMLPEGMLILMPSSRSRPEKNYGLFRSAVSCVEGAIALTLEEVPPSEVPLWLVASDVVLLTSDIEGSPVVTKEALCLGTRVVSVDVGDMAVQLEGLSGCAVSASRPEAIACCISRVLDEPGPDVDAARLRFDMNREVDRVMGVYEDVIGGPR